MGQTFTDLGLGAEVLCAIDTLGYEEPTPIQAQTIPLLLAGRDVLAQAQTGTSATRSSRRSERARRARKMTA